MNIKINDNLTIKVENEIPSHSNPISNTIKKYFRDYLITESPPNPDILLYIKRENKIENHTQESIYHISIFACFDKENFFIKDSKGNLLTIQANSLMRRPIVIWVSKDFNLRLFLTILHGIIEIGLLFHEETFVHGLSFIKNGNTYFCPALVNTGKTSLMIELLKKGASFLGDEWVILTANGALKRFKKPFEVSEWDLSNHFEIVKDKYGHMTRTLLKYYVKKFYNKKIGMSGAIPPFKKIERKIFRLLLIKKNIEFPLIIPLNKIKAEKNENHVDFIYFLIRTNSKNIFHKEISNDELIDYIIASYLFEFSLFWNIFSFKVGFPKIYNQITSLVYENLHKNTSILVSKSKTNGLIELPAEEKSISIINWLELNKFI